MESKTQFETHAHVMQRVPKTDANIYGANLVTSIQIDKPHIVIFGGEETSTIKDANYYASIIERLIKFYKITGVDIYSVYYDFQSTDRNAERANAFIAARSKILSKDGITTSSDVDTKYINDLYRIVVQPCITGDNGDKLPDDIALQRIRNTIFFTHCHGATPVRAFQDIMFKDMRQLGYTAPTINNIMKSLLVIQHAPISPLEKSRFNTVSFMSATDTRMNFHNQFSDYVAEHDADLAPSYFALGNFFASYNLTTNRRDEHQIVGLVPDEEQDKLTSYGEIIMAAERNALINAIKAIKKNTPIPQIRDLIAPTSKEDVVRPVFDDLSQNGEFFMQIMKSDLRLNKSSER